MGAQITVAIVDDDAMVRSALVSYLATDDGFRVVHELHDGAQALAVIPTDPVDVVVMDVRMPHLDGVRATEALRQLLPDTKILVLTSFDEDDVVRDALTAGANGFLLKDTSPAGLKNAIQAVMQGSSVVSPGPISRLACHQGRSTPRRGAADVGLSPREQECLELLCAAYTNTEIATALRLSESTVKTHVSAIMSKLEVTSRLKAVVRAHELGLITARS